MIFSKANFMVSQVASTDEFDQGLNGLRIEPDGTTVGGDSGAMMIVSPADKRYARVPNLTEEDSINKEGVVLDLDLVQDVIKNMPRNSKRAELQYAVLTQHKDKRRCEFTTFDMKKEKRVSDLPKTARYPEWKKALQKVAAGPNDDTVARVCVNRKKLISMLKALEAACPDKGDYNPVWIEFGKDGTGLMFRCVNWLTQQRAIGILQTFPTKEGWLSWSTWEKALWNLKRRVLKRRRRK